MVMKFCIFFVIKDVKKLLYVLVVVSGLWELGVGCFNRIYSSLKVSL